MNTKNKNTKSVDTRRLIELVRQQLPIWDISYEFYNDGIITEKCWKYVSGELKTDVGVIKDRWATLKNMFEFELEKVETLPEFNSVWPYFKQLLFLKDTIKRKKKRQSLPDMVSIDDTEDEEKFFELKNVNLSVPKEIKEEEIPSTSSVDKRTRSQSDMWNANIIKIESQNLYYSTRPETMEESVNDDFLYFKSLLPYVQKLSPEKKLLFRGRLQEILTELLYPANPSPKSSFRRAF